MIRALREKEFENVRRLSARERYRYFIKKVADSQVVWGLWSDGWALMGDDDGEAVPVWPHPRFAEAFATADWKQYQPREISLDELLSKWIPGMKADRRKFAVFPANEATTTASPEQLGRDLEQELAKYDL